MNKINVLICSPLPPPKGGIATWLHELVEANKSVQKVNIITFNTANKRPAGVYSKLRKAIDGFRLIFSQLRNFNQKLKNNRIDIVHLSSSGGFAHFRDLLFLMMAKLKNIPVVVQLHYGVSDAAYQWMPLSKIALYGLCKYADNILTLDNSFSFSSEKKPLLSINGMAPAPIGDLKKEKCIVFVGWIVEEKGIFELVEQWNNLENKHGWYLKIIGPAQPVEQARLNDKIIDDSILYLGELEREKVLNHVAGASVFALPSHTEGFPYAILEAMQSELAILASDVGGINQIFSYGNPGIIIPPKQSKKLACALIQLISNPQQTNEFGQSAFQIYSEHFTGLAMLNNLHNCWTSTLMRDPYA